MDFFSWEDFLFFFFHLNIVDVYFRLEDSWSVKHISCSRRASLFFPFFFLLTSSSDNAGLSFRCRYLAKCLLGAYFAVSFGESRLGKHVCPIGNLFFFFNCSTLAFKFLALINWSPSSRLTWLITSLAGFCFQFRSSSFYLLVIGSTSPLDGLHILVCECTKQLCLLLLILAF